MSLDLYCTNPTKHITKNNILIKIKAKKVLTTILKHLAINGSLHPINLSKKEVFDILDMLNGFSMIFPEGRGKIINLEFMKIFIDIETCINDTEGINENLSHSIFKRYKELTN